MSKQERQERLETDRQRRAGLRKLTLTEFLAARLDEDEAAAKACAQDAAGLKWSGKYHPSSHRAVEDEDGRVVVWDEGEPDEAQAAHIIRHDPARVLREVEAKRKILADLPAYSKQRRELRDHMYLPKNAGYHSGHADGTDDASRYVLRQLATVYSDHPDYDEAWRT